MKLGQSLSQSPRRIWAVAVNTFRQAVRNKILYALLVLAIAMIGSGVFLGQLALDQNIRIIQDFGLFFMTLFGMVIAVFVGVTLLYEEVQQRTVYVLLSTPLRRTEFLLGKYVGMLLTIGVQIAVMGAAVIILLWFQDAPVGAVLFQAIFLAFTELAVLTAVALLFSSFSTPYLSGFFTFGVFVMGRLSGDLLRVLPNLEPEYARTPLRFIAGVLPQLWRFDFTSRVVYGRPVEFDTFALTCLYAVTYSAVALAVAAYIFRRRDFV